MKILLREFGRKQRNAIESVLYSQIEFRIQNCTCSRILKDTSWITTKMKNPSFEPSIVEYSTLDCWFYETN